MLAEIQLIEGSWSRRVYFSELLKAPALEPGRLPADPRTRRPEDLLRTSSWRGSASRRPPARRRRDAPRVLRCGEEDRIGLRDAPRLLVGAEGGRGVAGLDSRVSSTPAPRSSRISKKPRCSSRLRGCNRSMREPARRSSSRSPTANSDFECRRVVNAVVRADPDPRRSATMLEPSIPIESDFEQASFLMTLPKRSRSGATPAAILPCGGIDRFVVRTSARAQSVVKRSDVAPETVIAMLRDEGCGLQSRERAGAADGRRDPSSDRRGPRST